MKTEKQMLFVFDRKLNNGVHVPNGLAERGPMWQRFLKKEEEYATDFCRTPMLTLLAAEDVAFKTCTFEEFTLLSTTERDQYNPIYLMEMLYSFRVWLPLRNGDSFPLHPFSQVPAAIVDSLNRGEMKLYLTHFKRPERDGKPWSIFSRTLGRIRNMGVDPRRVHFFGCTEDWIEQFESEKLTTPDLAMLGGVHYVPYFERGWSIYHRQYEMRNQTYPIVELEEDLARKPHDALASQKMFLCFNRELRAHRRVTLGFLSESGLLKDSMVSCPAPGTLFPLEKFDEFGEGLTDVFSDPRQLHYGEKAFLEFANGAPYTVDHPDLHKLHISWCTKEPFRQTYLSILTERLYHSKNDQVLFTSKIFKSVCSSHPFILLGGAKSLERLRSHGYQTFSGLFDESYDQISDPNLRMEMVQNQLLALSNLSPNAWRDLRYAMLPILSHNMATFRTRQDIPLVEYLIV